MKKSLVLLFCGAIFMCMVLWGLGVFDYSPVPRTISVTGECLTTAPKDRIAITLRVRTLDKSSATSMKMAMAKISEITDYLKDQDVEMQTTEYNSYERSEWNQQLKKTEDLGTETTIAVDISSKDMTSIENVLTKFAGQENVYTGNLRMYTSAQSMKQVLEKCLGIATHNARERANALISGDNQQTGRILAVAYNTVPIMQPRTSNFLTGQMVKYASATEGAFDTGTGLVYKDTEVSVTVSAIFEIK